MNSGPTISTTRVGPDGSPLSVEQDASMLRMIVDSIDQMIWSTRPDGYHDFYNRRWYDFTGMPYGSTDGEAWNGMFHPEDQERAWTRWRLSLETGEPYEIEYRLRHRSGAYRWVLGRAHAWRDRSGAISRWMGTCTDIHEQKISADQNAVISQELSHRIKNIFAVINGLIGVSARRFPEARAFGEDLKQRVAALGRAHDFARPHSPASAPIVEEVSVLGLIRALLAPYADEGRRIATIGDDRPVDDRGATPLALVFHELATNAAKYGALSTPFGAVEIAGEQRDDVYVLAGERRPRDRRAAGALRLRLDACRYERP